MEVFFVVLISCHLFVTKSMGSSAKGRFKNKIFKGDDALKLGVNNTGPKHHYSESGGHRTLVGNNAGCYTRFFVRGQPPTGLRPPNGPNIRYICQQLADFNDETYYATMFDQQLGIAVYAAYVVRHDEVPSIGTFPRISKWLQDPDIHHARQGSDNMYARNLQHIHKGHLVPAKTYSHDCIAMVSTFRYTNAVPQYAAFNTGQWGQYEDKVRRLAEMCRLNGGNLYLMTGTSAAQLLANGPPHAQQQPLNYFPVNNPNTGTNIAIPNSMWTAGCCINAAGAVGGFAAIGNNDQIHPVLEQKTVAQLQDILAIGLGGGAVHLFPGNPRCSVDTNQFRYNNLAMHGGGWTKSVRFR